MAVNYLFRFKTDDAIVADSDGNIVSIQADLEGWDSEDGTTRPRGVMKHAVTIRCDVKKGTLDAADPTAPGYVALADVVADIKNGPGDGDPIATSWMINSLKNQMPPRGSGKANLYEYYVDYIAERIVANTQMFDDSLGVKDPEPVKLGISDVTTQPVVPIT